MKHIKQISILAIALLILIVQLIIPASAADTVLQNLMPSKDTKIGKLTLEGCTITENKDGSVTFTLTATTASFKMVFAENVFKEGSGGTIYSGDAFDITKGAYVVYDYASADGVAFNSFVAHYTRKDKAANNTLADLYLNSMEGNDFRDYQKQVGTGYGVWDLGSYVSKSKGDAGIFDDHMHRFCDLDVKMSGKVGGKLTIYKFYVSSTADVKDLGKVRPEPTANTSSAVTSSAVTSSEVTSSVATSSVATSSAATSSTATSSAAQTSSTAASSTAASSAVSSTASDDNNSDENSNWWIYVVIGVVVVAAAGVIIYFATKKKDNK